MPGENCDQLKSNEDKRVDWERPIFRRLDANAAQGGNLFIDDGNCGGTSSAPQHSGCFNAPG